MDSEPVAITPPMWIRGYVVVFCAVWCGSVASFGVASARRGSPAAVLAVVLVAIAIGFAYRLTRLGVVAAGDLLTVRNTWRTRTLRRREIAGFRPGTTSHGLRSGQALFVLLADDTIVALDVTTSLLGGRGRRRLAERRDQLQHWLGRPL